MQPKLRKVLTLLLCFLLCFEQSSFAQVAGQLDISGHLPSLRNAFVPDVFRPLHLRYLSYDSLNNSFKLFLDKGSLKNPNPQELQDTTKTLLNYFFVGIALPNDTFWVNLRPDAEDQIIDDRLAQTDIGKIMLETDLQLKKDTARFTSPETLEGKEYWNKLYKKAGEIFGTEDITIPTLTRPWIVPDEIIIRETLDSAYLYKATLKVMLEQDYLKDSAVYNFKDDRLKELNEYSSQLIRELIIPKLTKEVNSSKRYASLRQVYYSLIMAQWFKVRHKGLYPATEGSPERSRRTGTVPSLIDSRNLTDLTSKELWSKTTYFKEYQKSFKDGEYNVKEPVYTPYGQTIRSYFSGGMRFGLKPGDIPPFGGQRPSSGPVSIVPATGSSSLLNKHNVSVKIDESGDVNIGTRPGPAVSLPSESSSPIRTDEPRMGILSAALEINAEVKEIRSSATPYHKVIKIWVAAGRGVDTSSFIAAMIDALKKKYSDWIIHRADDFEASLKIGNKIVIEVYPEETRPLVETSSYFLRGISYDGKIILINLIDDRYIGRINDRVLPDSLYGITIKFTPVHSKEDLSRFWANAVTKASSPITQDPRASSPISAGEAPPKPTSSPISALTAERIRRFVLGLEYPDETARKFITLIAQWLDKNEVSLIDLWREQIEQAQKQFVEKNITLEALVSVERRMINELAKKIMAEIESGGRFDFDLYEISEIKKANCTGYTTLLYILVGVLGLVAIPTLVFEFENRRLYPGEEHIMALIKLSDGKVIQLDPLAPHPISEPFALEQAYSDRSYYLEIKNHDNPLKIHRKIKPLANKNSLIADIYNHRGAQESNPDTAIVYYKKALARDASFMAAHSNLAITYGMLGRYPEALASMDRAISLLPEKDSLYYNRGNIHLRSGDIIQAIQDYTYTISLNPELVEAYYNRGNSYLKLSDLSREPAEKIDYLQKAETDFSEGIAIATRKSWSERAELYFNRGVVRAALNKLSEAADDLNYSLALDPGIRERAEAIARIFGLSLRSDKDASSPIKLSGQQSATLTSLIFAGSTISPIAAKPPASSPAETKNHAMTPGGIDFRTLPIVTQAVTNLSGMLRDSPLRPKGVLSGVEGRGQSLLEVNLNEEWLQIEKMASSGITPSSERIKEYIQTSCAQDNIVQDKDKILLCISDILRLQEERCDHTDATLRDILVVLESMQRPEDLKEVFLGV